MANPPENLEAALLHACGATYTVAPGTSEYKADAEYHRGVGFHAEPQTIVSGPGGINAATVGQTEWGIMVAFRGTLSFSLSDSNSWLDWLNDFMAAPVSQNEGPFRLPGWVQQGFFDCTTSILPCEINTISPGVGIETGVLELSILR